MQKKETYKADITSKKKNLFPKNKNKNKNNKKD